MQNRVAELIESLGGTTAVSAGLGYKWPSRVQGWKQRGRVASDQIPDFIAFARSKGKEIDLDDCLPARKRAA